MRNQRGSRKLKYLVTAINRICDAVERIADTFEDALDCLEQLVEPATVTIHTQIVNPPSEQSVYALHKNLNRMAASHGR